jgi:hypothetical protein
VITCNRCGNMSPAGTGNCQTCGAPLSSNIESNSGRMAAPQEQPELPAWLESLRAGERSAAPANNASTFSTADLIDDGALPGWMRSGRQEASDGNASDPRRTLRPSALPGPNTDDAAKGINAQSLIDEQALPSWMHENKPTTGPIPQGGIAASSLVQPDAAPDWMKSLQNSPVAHSAMSATPPQQAQPSGQSGHEGPGEGKARSFSAGDLIDQQSLPSWMSGQDGRNVPPAPGQVTPGSLSSSSLPDMNSLSPWMSGNGPQQNGSFPPAQQAPLAPNPAPWSASPLQAQQSPVWQPTSQPPVGMNNNAPGASNHLSASSFIDPNAVPEWLRSGEGQSAVSQQQQGPAAHNVPPRVDNVRVPSRPRGEINPNQGNEAAANVFASMLGVASSTPNFIGAPYGMPGGQAPQIPGQMPGGLPNPQQGYLPAGFNSGVYQVGNPESQGNYQTGNPGPQSGYQMGNMGPQAGYQTGNLGQQGNYQMGNPQANPYSLGGMPPMQSGAPMPGGPTGADPRPAEKPTKKGIFETIRDWFR